MRGAMALLPTCPHDVRRDSFNFRLYLQSYTRTRVLEFQNWKHFVLCSMSCSWCKITQQPRFTANRSPCIIVSNVLPVHDVKAWGWITGQFHSFLTSACGHLHSPGKSPRLPLNGLMDGPHSRLDVSEKRIVSCHYRESNPGQSL